MKWLLLAPSIINEIFMKKTILKGALLCGVLMASACSNEVYIGSGELRSEARDVPSFNRVSSEGVFEVHIVQGTQQSVSITGDHNILHKVRTEVVNNELRLYLDRDDYRNITLRADIVTPSLIGLRNSGVGDMYVHEINQAGTFRILNSGTGDIRLDGQAASLEVDNTGSGDVKGFLFEVGECSVNIEGSGNFEIHCDDHLEVGIFGSGDVYYLGEPVIEADISGSGSVINAN